MEESAVFGVGRARGEQLEFILNAPLDSLIPSGATRRAAGWTLHG